MGIQRPRLFDSKFIISYFYPFSITCFVCIFGYCTFVHLALAYICSLIFVSCQYCVDSLFDRSAIRYQSLSSPRQERTDIQSFELIGSP